MVWRFGRVGICFLLRRADLPRGRTVSASKSWAAGLGVGRSWEQPTSFRWPCSVRSLWAEDQKQAFDAIWGTTVSCFVLRLPFLPPGHCPRSPISLDIQCVRQRTAREHDHKRRSERRPPALPGKALLHILFPSAQHGARCACALAGEDEWER